MRFVIAILGVLLVAGTLGGVKFKQISGLISMGKAMQKAGPPPDPVGTAVAQEQTWGGALAAVGSVAAAKGVSVSNDSPGVVSKILFESGAVVRQGQVLVELDTSVERAQLASAQAKLELAGLTVKRTRALVQTNAIPAAQLDGDEAQLKTTTTDLDALRAQIDRKVVRAPFSGRLGIRAINLGQYLNPGTTITVLAAIQSVYVDFSLPQQRLPDIKVGMPVHISVEGAPDLARDGVIAAIDPDVDSATRALKLRANVPNKEEKLRPGMFVNVSVELPQTAPVVTAPATAVVHAPYGDSVFVVEDKKDEGGKPVTGADGKPAKMARQQFVRLGEARGDFVSLLDGVKAGQELVSAGAFKLHNGGGVVVNNDVKPTPEMNPKPENR